MAFEKRLISKRYENDRVALVSLNSVQMEELTEYRRRVLDGTYQFTSQEECAICGSRSGYIISEKDRYGIAMSTILCNECGLIYTKERLAEESLKTFYSEQYRDLYTGVKFSEGEEGLNAYFSSNGIDSRFANNIIRASQLEPGSLILEIGAGGGWNLSSFKKMGFRVVGYDYDDRFLEAGRRKGLELYHGGTEEAIASSVKADLVLLIDVLEHFRMPLLELERIKNLLREGGFVFVKTPGLRAAIYGRAEGDLLGYLQNAHMYLFEKKTLKMLMEKTGYSCITCGEQVFGLFQRERGDVARSTVPLDRGCLVWRTCKRIERMRKWWIRFYAYQRLRGKERHYDLTVHWLSYFFNLNYLSGVYLRPLMIRLTGALRPGR